MTLDAVLKPSRRSGTVGLKCRYTVRIELATRRVRSRFHDSVTHTHL